MEAAASTYIEFMSIQSDDEVVWNLLRESTSEPPEVPTTLFPLRLIDVDATLEPANEGRILMCKAEDWNFHIISHTWSRGIRDLSRAVQKKDACSGGEGAEKPGGNSGSEGTVEEDNDGAGKPAAFNSGTPEGEVADKDRTGKPAALSGTPEGEVEDKYRDAFEKIDWIKEGEKDKKLNIAYRSVKEFLEILQRQGVKKVWLDAICIDQGSNEEKAREIPLMKDFYRESLACFVPINGFADENSKPVCKGACGSKHIIINDARASFLHQVARARGSINNTGAASMYKRKLVYKDGKIWNIPFPIYDDASEGDDATSEGDGLQSNNDQAFPASAGDGSQSNNDRAFPSEGDGLQSNNDRALIPSASDGSQSRNDREFPNSASIRKCDGCECGGVNDYNLSTNKQLFDLRWLNRVWTLQELLLPKRTYFIVQLEPWMEEWLAMEIQTGIPTMFHCLDDSKKKNFPVLLPHYLDYYEDKNINYSEVKRKTKKMTQLHDQKTKFACHQNLRGIEALDLACDYTLSKQTYKLALHATNQYHGRTMAEDHLGCDILASSVGSFALDTRRVFVPEIDIVGSQMLKKLNRCRQPRLYNIDTLLLLYLGILRTQFSKESIKSDVFTSDLEMKFYHRFTQLVFLLQNDQQRSDHIERLLSSQEKIDAGIIAAFSPNKLYSNHFIMDEICRRECHEKHEEDRVLGMLGLVSKPNMADIGLSIKTSPEEQIVERASHGVLEENFLLELCIRDYYSGRNKHGMSWIPDLTRNAMDKHRPLNDNSYLIRHTSGYLKAARLVNVSKDGPITLQAPVVLNGFIVQGDKTWSWFILGFHLPRKSSAPSHPRLCRVIGPFAPTNLMTHDGSQQLYKETLYETPLIIQGSLREGGVYLPLKNHDHIHAFQCFIIPILVVPVSRIGCCALVCIRSHSEPYVFHKTGVITLTDLMLQDDAINDSSIDFKDFTIKFKQWEGLEEVVTIGGFGTLYLDEHLKALPCYLFRFLCDIYKSSEHEGSTSGSAN